MGADGTALGRSGTVAADLQRPPGTIPDPSANSHIVKPIVFEPVELFTQRDHAYKSRGKKLPGCGATDPSGPHGQCRKSKYHAMHMGAPHSLRILGSGSPRVYQGLKEGWENLFGELLSKTSLPKPCNHISVEGQVCFHDRRDRDQGNHRFILEKALGDALQTGGWLLNDDWDSYEFGGLERTYEPRVSWTRLLLFPS